MRRRKEGHWAEGLAAAQKLENLVRRRQGADNMNYAGVLHNEGMFLNNLGRYQEAVEKLNAALAIKLRNNDVASTLRTSNILVASLGMLERRAEATTVAERALALGTGAFGANDVRLSDTLSALGGLARDKENLTESVRYFERALAGLQAANSSPSDVGSAMDNLGDVYGLQGRFDDGERMLKQALDLFDRSFGNNAEAAPNYDKMLNDLGNLYLDAGRLADAEATMRRSLAITRARHGEAHPNVAGTMGNLATVLEHEGRYAEAEKLYQQALQAYERIFGPNHATTAIGLNNLANVYAAQGRNEAAAGLQERVLAIYEKAFGPDSPDVGRALNNLANSYTDMGRTAQALDLYRRSLAVMERKFGEGSGPTALAAGSLGQALAEAGQTDEARPYLVRCLDIDERIVGSRHPQLIKDLRSLALLDLKTGNLTDARGRLDRALPIAQDRLGPRHHDTIATLINLADVDRREGKWQDALGRLRLAATALNAQQNVQFIRFPEIDPWLIDTIWRVSDGKPDNAAKDEAFGAAQRAHETKAGAALSQMAARFGAGNDAIAALVRRQQDLKASLDTLDKRVTSELGQADGKRNDTLIASLRAQTAQTQKSLDDVTAQLDRSFPAYADLSNPQPLSLAQTQGLLKPDEALVVFIVLGDKTYAFAVTREASALRQIALGSREVSDRVAHLRQGLSDPETAQSSFDLDASFELYNGLFGPIAADIAGKPKLLIVSRRCADQPAVPGARDEEAGCVHPPIATGRRRGCSTSAPSQCCPRCRACARCAALPGTRARKSRSSVSAIPCFSDRPATSAQGAMCSPIRTTMRVPRSISSACAPDCRRCRKLRASSAPWRRRSVPRRRTTSSSVRLRPSPASISSRSISTASSISPLMGSSRARSMVSASRRWCSRCRTGQPAMTTVCSPQAVSQNSSSMPTGRCCRPATRPRATSPAQKACRVSRAPSSMPAHARCWFRTGRSIPMRRCA